MLHKLKACRISGSCFRSDYTGSATIETVLWLPMFIFILTLLAETSMVFADQSTVTRIIEDTNRQLSTGAIATVKSAVDTIKSRVTTISPNAVVTTTLANGIFTSSVSMPIEDLIAPGLGQIFVGFNVVVVSQFTDERFS